MNLSMISQHSASTTATTACTSLANAACPETAQAVSSCTLEEVGVQHHEFLERAETPPILSTIDVMSHYPPQQLLESSLRSQGTAMSTTTSAPSTSASSNGSRASKERPKSASLGRNLTWDHKHKNPLDVYEIVKVIGNGSMGRVCSVRKRPQCMGGSARLDVSKRSKNNNNHPSAAHQATTALPPSSLPIITWETCFSMPLVNSLRHVMFWSDDSSPPGNSRDLWQSPPPPIVEDLMDVDTDHIDGPPSMRTDSSSGSTDISATKKNQTTTTASTKVLYAMKSIHYQLVRDQTFVQELQNEIAVLRTLDHPHIVRVRETFDWQRQLFVIMELCSGGDLYTRDPYTEVDAIRITRKILSAVAYMHSKEVIHRDLKYENILFVNESPQSTIKLIDFGLSKQIVNHEPLSEGAGTIYTMAPEVMRGHYGKEADLWSIGVITFMLLSSRVPFYGTTQKHLIKKILSGHYSFKSRKWNEISNQAKRFIEDLLVSDPADRVSADEALPSTWLNRNDTATLRGPNEAELTNVCRCIQRYVTYPKLRKLSLMILAHQSTSDEVGFLRKVFQQYDSNRNGTLDYDEFRAALEDVGYTEDDCSTVFDAVDVDGTGKIQYTEFLAAALESTGWISEERLAEAFDRLDHDDTGYISRENLHDLLGETYPIEEIDAMIQEALSSENAAQGISYADFLSQWSDDKEVFEREHQKYAMEDLVISAQKDVANISELSLDTMDDPGREIFREQKALSHRKMTASLVAQSSTPKISIHNSPVMEGKEEDGDF